MKKIIISGLILLGTGIGVLYYLKIDGTGSIKMFPTQTECEKKTGRICYNEGMCDDNCPRGFHKGWWAPSSPPLWNCAKVGEKIGAQGMPESCCQWLSPLWGHPGGYTGECSLPPAPGWLSICSSCGNNFCEEVNGENKCNCPKDCE